MTDPQTSLDWDQVRARERNAIREPDGRQDGPDRPLTGLAFSGGGIRSATFNLGVTQALAELKLLRQFDYLSCVSGGGYIGGWLSAFIHLKCNGRVEDAEEKLKTGGEENSAIRFLRSYSNYLTPKASFFSADTLTAIATYLRNLYLNLVLLVLALGSLLLLPRLLVWLVRWMVGWEGIPQAAHTSLLPLFGGGIACIGFAMIFIGLNLGSRGAFKSRPFYTRQSGVISLVVMPGLISAWLIGYGFYVGAPQAASITLPGWVMWGMLVYTPPWMVGWSIGRFLSRRNPGRPQFTLRKIVEMTVYALLAGALGGVLLAAFAEVSQWIPRGENSYSGSWIASALSTALLMKFYSLTVVGHIGLMGRLFSNESREWWARLGGWTLLVSLIWAALFAVVFIAPAFFSWAPQAVIAAGGTTWLLSTASGVILGRSAKTVGQSKKSWRDMAAQAMPYVFVVGLLGLLSLGLHRILILPVFCPDCGRHAIQTPSFIGTLHREAFYFQHVDIVWVAILCVGSLLAAAALAARFDVNLFSIYHFYRQRLVRCYLGASRCKLRSPHPFTGFDPRDDLRLAELCRIVEGKPQCQRPYPIHNTAMNLVAGKQLAWQERRAAAFAFTPMQCGYSFTLPDEKGLVVSHYRPTSQYMHGVWMGSAMAISGAAASPNMGYHSAPALTFLMTVFNVRLGHWSPNPADDTQWTMDGPPFGGTYLLKELFGQTQYTSSFVYLSDGGHFENLGIYELVRRRCACIVAVDAGEDADSRFEDLGNAIRKCYADFGVVIDIHAEDLQSGYSAVGRITYPDAPPATLIYIKPRLTGTEPADLLNYKCTHPGFPHESTADQWFDESQFESYRKLGHWIARAVMQAPQMEARQRQDMTADSAPEWTWICDIFREQRRSAT
jgi:predicted acylesterase/phospholipase RssA